jgi:translation initiation factor 2 gamma subunit (eIF-2gamma)
MSQQIPPVINPAEMCPKCGAQNYSWSKKCWVCLVDMPTEPVVMATVVSPPRFVAGSGLTIATSAMVPILLGIALYTSVAIDQTFAVIVAGGAMAMAVLTIVIGVQQGKVLKAFLSLLVSVMVGITICFMLIIAAFVLLFIACLNSMG